MLNGRGLRLRGPGSVTVGSWPHGLRVQRSRIRRRVGHSRVSQHSHSQGTTRRFSSRLAQSGDNESRDCHVVPPVEWGYRDVTVRVAAGYALSCQHRSPDPGYLLRNPHITSDGGGMPQ